MSTVIDALVVDIQSNSTSAAAGIDALAVSLGKLKATGTVGVAVRNLNKLSEALRGFSGTSNVANNLQTLATSMSTLKGIGSVANIANGITKLGAALATLPSLNIEGIGPKIQSIATAVAPLSEVKAGGLNTMVNGLRKIGEVTASLKDETIAAFADRVRRLSEVLTPLSSKMTTVQAGLRSINSSAKTTSSGIHTLNSKINVTTLNLTTLIATIRGAMILFRPLIALFSKTISEAIEWDGISARFGRGFGEQASEVYEWVKRLNEEMGINIQQFMQYSSTYATMLKGFGLGDEDANKMAVGYMELTYDIWAGYNDIYKSLDDVATAVRSAISGDVKTIRRAGFTIIEATLEQTAANHGLAISLEHATEAEKSYLRYLALVDQAKAQNLVGTYAQELSTAEGLMRTFNQQLKTLAQSFGSLFLPVLVKVMPYLSAFVELLTDACRAIAAFFGITLQEVDWSNYGKAAGGIDNVTDSADDATDALGSATKAAKDLQKATLGIDELNVISPPSSSGGSGSGSGSGAGGIGAFEDMDIDSLWDESIFSTIGNQVDEIKEKIKEWLPLIELVGGALAALGMVNLITHIGDALAKMNLLQKALATVAIVAIEAALVFTFADNYLEEGNLMNLVGEAIATAVGSYLLYRTWGPKGLVIGIAVSVAAQLAAIVLNLADGGVEISDPELWIQSAFTAALGGVAGGWLAYKGLIPVSTGKGVGLGLLAVASLTLAAITIGEVTANGEITKESVLTGLGSVLMAAGFGFVIGGPMGAAIGAAVGLTVNIVGAAIGMISASAKEGMQKSLEERFGDVELSVSEAKIIVEKLIPEWSEGVILAVDLREDVAKLAEHINTQLGEMARYEWQVTVGIALSENDKEQYLSAVSNFVTAAQQYINQRGYALEVGLKATGASDFVIDTSAWVTSAASGELERLGKELQSVVNEAYEDGLLDIDELEAIQTIRNDMMEIVNALAASEIEAEFGMLEMKWSGIDLTPDSFETMMEEWNTMLKETVKPALENTVKENLKTLEGNVEFAKVQLAKNPGDAEAQQMLKDAEAALQEYMDSNPLQELTIEACIESVRFAINTLQDAFAVEIERVEKAGYFDFAKNLAFSLEVYPEVKYDDGNGDIYGNFSALIAQMQNDIGRASYTLSREARKSLESMLEALEPTMADLEEVAAENRKLGKAVPQNVREGLSDYNELKALAGDIDGINYMIGEGFSTDPVFLNTLATMENAGALIDESVAEGLANNLDYVTDEATGLVVGIKNAVTGETTYITPILEKNLGLLGVNLGDALGGKYQYVYDETTGVLKSIVDSATGNSVWVNNTLENAGKEAGAELSNGVKAGAESTMKSQEKSWKDWAIWPWNWFKDKNEINSPSKLFERGGQYLVQGLAKGLGTTGLRDALSDLWEKAQGWWDGKRNLSDANVDVKLTKSGWSSVSKWVGNIPVLSQGIKLSKSSWSSVKNWVGSISTLSQGISLKKSGWSSVSKWVGSMPSLSAKIGLKKNGWSSVSSWLGGLNYKLKFTLPKIGVNWGTKEVMGFKIKYPSSFYTYAKGGFPDIGEMFIAREAGPEMVGRMGSRSVVANNDQIVEGISEGVYAAVVAAMRQSESNGGQSVNVYLDGKQITSTVERRQRERGMSLMGSQVYSY